MATPPFGKTVVWHPPLRIYVRASEEHEGFYAATVAVTAWGGTEHEVTKLGRDINRATGFALREIAEALMKREET